MNSEHIKNQIKQAGSMTGDNTLYVIGVLSNYALYHSRYRLFRNWYQEMCATPNVKVLVVELAHGDHKHELEGEIPDDCYLPLRTPNGHLWLKEALVNAAVRYLLPKDANYLAWIDCDISFRDPSWAQQTIVKLQSYALIQPWATCTDLGPNGNAILNHKSFASLYASGVPIKSTWDKDYEYAHTGYAWACTRTFFENTRGLMDFCLVGSADHHQAWGAINRVFDSVHGKMSDGFKQSCVEWAEAAYRATNGNIGFVQTRIEHHFHGSKNKRQYRERWQMFIDHQFDPKKDLRRDKWGIPYLYGKPALDEEIRRYNLLRHEDSTEA